MPCLQSGLCPQHLIGGTANQQGGMQSTNDNANYFREGLFNSYAIAIRNLEPHEVEQGYEYTMSMNECNEFMTIKNKLKCNLEIDLDDDHRQHDESYLQN